MKDNLSEKMYKEHILELYKSPDNLGILKNPTHKHTETNSSCGDEITMHLNISDGKIKDIKFQGSGCVMSIVSSSMLSTKVKGMKVKEVLNLTRDDVLDLIKINITP